MATVYELARELGNEILKTKEVEKLLKAKEIFEADEEAVKLLDEYQKLQQDMQTKMVSGHSSVEEQKEIQTILNEKSERIKKNDAACQLFEAENEFNRFLQSIFSIIQTTMSGEESACSCSSDGCASCSGCH